MHILTTYRTYKQKTYRRYFLAESFRDSQSQYPRKRILANLSKLPETIIEQIKVALKAKPMVSIQEVGANTVKDHGLVAAYWGLGESLGLWKLLNKYLGQQTERVMGMVINRLGDPKAKYSLRDWLVTTTLCGVLNRDLDYFHYNRCYESLDVLHNHQIKIEDEIQKLNPGKRRLLLYDLTSSYCEGEGENESLIKYGYNRDKKQGKKQIVIALVTDEAGLPMSVEVLPGNTQDRMVLKDRIEELKQRFKVEEVILVFDRGMATEPNKQTLKAAGINYITALKPSQIKQLLKDEGNQALQLGLFDKRDLLELEVNTGTIEAPCYERLILCQSEAKQRRDQKQHRQLMTKTENKLTQIKQSVDKGRLKDQVKIAKRIGKWINQWGQEKYFDIKINPDEFQFRRNQLKVDTQELLYGMYVLATNNGVRKADGEPAGRLPREVEELSATQVREAYRSLNKVEAEFRILKSSLEIRPIRHWKTSRIKGHVFVCFLALWLKWHFDQRLEPLWKQKYTRSQVEAELLQLKSVKLLPDEVFNQPMLTRVTPLQKEIFRNLKVEISSPLSH